MKVDFVGNENDTRLCKESDQKAWLATPGGLEEVPDDQMLPGFEEATSTFVPRFFDINSDLLRSAATLARKVEAGELERCGMLANPLTGRVAVYGVGE
jgi:hypothetical protein